MRTLFVVDPIEGLDASIDTSIGLMHASQELGAEVWVAEAKDLEAVGGRAVAQARQLKLAPAFLRTLARQSAAKIAKRNPRWDPVDVAIERETFESFHRAAIPAVLAPSVMRAPEHMAVPSLVILADNSYLVKPQVADRLRATGFDVRVVAGSGHVINRDDHDGFMRALEGWI